MDPQSNEVKEVKTFEVNLLGNTEHILVPNTFHYYPVSLLAVSRDFP